MEDSKTTLFLQDEYYTLKDKKTDGMNGSFLIAINPESRVFKGHFPGNPICPGVCHIEMIRECSSMLMDRDMRILKVKKCRFLSVARPNTLGTLTISVGCTPAEDGTYTVSAEIKDDSTTYLTLAGVLKESAPNKV